MSKPKQTLINESDDGHVVGIADTMRAEVPLMRFNSPIAIFGGCYSNLEATVALFQHLDRLGISASHVALQWTMSQGFSSIPVVGATKVSQLEDNLKTVDISLSQEHLQKLDEVSTIDLGFPGEFFKEEAVRNNSFGGFYDKVEKRT